MKDFIEQQIIDAVRKLLTRRVNEFLNELDYVIPIIEFSNYSGSTAVTPVITLSSCECSEKERLLRIDAYSLVISFIVFDNPDCELCCYAYAAAVDKAIMLDTTLGGVVNRTVLVGKKYKGQQKLVHGDGWELNLTFRIIVEGMNYAG